MAGFEVIIEDGRLAATSATIGVRLRTIRRQRQLSSREVEERSLRCAQEWSKQSYQISASWLDRVEREEHELTVNRLIVMADIYDLPPEQLFRTLYPLKC
jgi:transcriptional regulator with XRE-family HTH domain